MSVAPPGSDLLFQYVPSPSSLSPVYDLLGVPQDKASAFAMTEAKVRSAASRLMADMHGETVDAWLASAPVAKDGTALLDSLQAVFIVAAFNKPFGKHKLIRLSKIPKVHWASLDGVTDVIFTELQHRAKD